MLPLQQAYEVKHSILEYLKATFNFKQKAVFKAFFQFVTHHEEGIFKGPYISLKLPFVKAKEDEIIPLEIVPNFPPYDHQLKAFSRLTTKDGHKPQSTLVTTGTSSGKTECFLYPILDFCYKNIDRKGIKVIILYPMNALATDQAKRLAETIWNDNRIKGKITAGLFIGEGKDKKKFPDMMGAENIIENRTTIIENPPDILLTNFKMLDYALLRSQFDNLWSFNYEDISLLQFLVLDELHTYDGAQGTDVANLIRRLKLKLGIQKGQVCAVGTSATMGSGEDSAKLLTGYAEKVFGETFENGSIIVENRVEVNDFFVLPESDLEKYIPRQTGMLESRLLENETYTNYIGRQKRLWQIPETDDAVQLGEELKKLRLVKDLVSLTNKEIIHLDQLLHQLADSNQDFKRLPEWDAINEMNPREEVINSLLALISEAKIGTDRKFPFLYLQIQLWVRELGGVLRELSDKPKFTWKDKVGDKYESKALPAYFCRECGASGWLGVKDDNKNHFLQDTKQVYEYYFSNHKNIYFINTSENKHIDEYEPTNQINDYINLEDFSLHEKQGNNTLKISAARKLKDTKARHICPECNTENDIAIIGTRVATLSSVTVSQVLASDLDPRTEKYRKILAFTNSVQDAAHQAGFVEARNYRFTFRSSLQKVVNQNLNPVNINDLQKQFVEYWKQHSDGTGQNQEDAYYYRFFPADYHGKVDIDNDYREAKKFIPAFKTEFDIRMNWEILSEYGYNALIGRTLEKSNASAVKFDSEKLKVIFPLIKAWLSQNTLSIISEAELLPFLNGILHRMRTRGGIDHEHLSKFRTNNLSLWDLNWMKDNRHFLNKMYGSHTRFPRLLTTQPHNRSLLDSTYTNTNNWYRSYFIKSFPMASSYNALVNEFYIKIIEAFVLSGIMNKKGSGENENYAIEPAVILIENKVSTFICDACGSKLFVAKSDEISVRTKCLNYTCPGSYSQLEKSKPNYYQLVYNRNQSPRIYATEHTGILERKDREIKEIDFKERPRFNSLNTIVSTSTLEMGIDIGTLNTAINNSVPPLTSNFLQRVGRAGRSSGSALIINFAQNKAHDLFYYEEPIDMMAGEIATPGCYLEAKDILYRHFFAYCLDCWSKADPKNNSIPVVILLLQLYKIDLSSTDFFANRVISFIKAKEHSLLSEFSSFYRPDLQDSKPLDNLKTYLLEEGFYLGFKSVFVKLKEEYLHISEVRKGIEAAIKTLPNDEERRELEAERKALYGLQRLLDNRSVLEHLTNIGLLPNYAFPETGVTLNARVIANKAKASENIPTDKQFEIVRSSKSAIKEFAPDNYFYSQGFKFAISGLNTFDWKDAGTLLVKRFCSNCDHLAEKVTSTEAHCPKCGDASWASDKNQHVFVKLNGVKSINFRDKSTLDDTKDERDSIRYRISRHLKFDKNSFQGAWGMKEIPFGVEYVKNVDITEINLGLSSSVNANKIIINQQEDVPYHGFVTCKYCGKSTSKLNQKEYKYHYGYCKHKERDYPGKSDDVFEDVFLLREMKTEALKVLLPVQEFESEATINMFKAGLELGLKKYYNGNPQHLGITDYSEYNEKNSRFDKYVVMYDNIPGGTGYLEKLFSPKEFTDIITKAYLAIKNCKCKDKGKDGCYRCIFTYSNQYIHKELSRKKAEDLFKKIVDSSEAWESYTSGLGALTSNGNIEESELEERFIRSLRNYLNGKNDPGFKFEDFPGNGIVNYKFKISQEPYSYSYIIRPQYELGTANGVRFNTRTDFYISLTGIEKNGIAIDNEELLSSTKHIAIYLDGYTFHATEEKCRFFDDLKKRLAISDSADILSWTLTWSDIDRFETIEAMNDQVAKEFRRDSLFLDLNKYRQAINTYKSIPYWNLYKSNLFESKNSFERLIWLLSNPLNENKSRKKIALLLSLRQDIFGVPSADNENIDLLLNDTNILIDKNIIAKNKSNGDFYIFPDLPDTSAISQIKVAIKVSNLEMKSSISIKTATHTLDKSQWETFWHVFNLVQPEIWELDDLVN